MFIFRIIYIDKNSHDVFILAVNTTRSNPASSLLVFERLEVLSSRTLAKSAKKITSVNSE